MSRKFEHSSVEDKDMTGLEKAKYVPNARSSLYFLCNGFLFTKDKLWNKFRTVTTTVKEKLEGEEVTTKMLKRQLEVIGMIWKYNQLKK